MLASKRLGECRRAHDASDAMYQFRNGALAFVEMGEPFFQISDSGPPSGGSGKHRGVVARN